MHQMNQPLRIEDMPMPERGDGQVLVQVETSGLRRTDTHAAHGDWPVEPTPPFIPGHEAVGIVTRSGPDVVHIKEGDRVAVHLAETVELHVDGRTEVVTESRQLEEVNESFEQIQKGEVDARLVFDFR